MTCMYDFLPGVSFQFAWRHILKEAHVVIYTRNLQLYSKPGNVDNAIDDFYALHPTYITTVTNILL